MTQSPTIDPFSRPDGSTLTVRPETSAFTLAVLASLTGMLVPAVIAYGFATMTEPTVVAVALMALAILLTVALPHWGLILFVGLFYIRPEETIEGMASLHLVQTMSVATLFAWWYNSSLKRMKLTRSPANVLVVGFAVVVLAILESRSRSRFENAQSV